MAHTFVNTGFETAGATPGLASGWTVAIFATAEEYASYDVAVPEPVEDFEEEWSSNEDGSFVLTATTAAVYDVAQPEAYEDFEEDWSNTPFFLTLPVVAVASYDTLTPEDFEDFEEEWKDNETDVAEFIGLGVDIAAAAYDLGVPESREDFEEEWRSNEDDITVFVGVGTDLVRATYDGENFEDFEETDLRMQNNNAKGTISMANAGPNTNGSQFFINVGENVFLNSKHTVFGKVTAGYEVVEEISKVATMPGDRPVVPVVIESIEVA